MTIKIIGGGLAGSECALASRGYQLDLFEMRPVRTRPRMRRRIRESRLLELVPLAGTNRSNQLR